MTRDLVVFDLEVLRCPGDEYEGKKLGWDDTDKLGLAVGAVYEELHDRFRLYGPDDRKALEGRLAAADEVVSFNGANFDLPVVTGAAKDAWKADPLVFVSEKTLRAARCGDLLRAIWRAQFLNPDQFHPATHGGWSLGVVAQATLGRGKSGHGAQAPKDFAAGKWAQVSSYAMDDVALTRDLYRFVLRYGFLLGPGDRKLPIPRKLLLED